MDAAAELPSPSKWVTLAVTSAGQPSWRQRKNAGNFSDAAARRDAEDNASVGRLYSSAGHYASVADSVLGSRTCSIMNGLENTTTTIKINVR